MKKSLFFILIILTGFAATLKAQQRGEKIESIKVAYLSEKLNLDPKTAERFWPLYNQYDDEMRVVLQESKRANENRDADEILDQEQKALDIKRKYSAQFLKVISNEQLATLYRSEKEFYKMLIRRMNKMEQRQDRMRDPDRPRMQDRPMMQDRPRMNPRSSSPDMDNRPGRYSGEEMPQRRMNR